MLQQVVNTSDCLYLYFTFCILFRLIDPFDTYCFLVSGRLVSFQVSFFSMACISSSIASIHFFSVTASLKLSGSLYVKKQNRAVSSMTWVASYNSFRFLILLGSSDEDADGGVDDDPGVFLLLNTGNLCTRLHGSSAGNIGPSANIIGTFTSSSRIKLVPIHLTAS